MRHFTRLNRVACGILGRGHPSVLTLLAQKTADLRPDHGRRAPRVIYCASVSLNLRCVSTIVRPTPTCVSYIARRAVHYCAPLHLSAPHAEGRVTARRSQTYRPAANLSLVPACAVRGPCRHDVMMRWVQRRPGGR
jgi:hypothetical protein